ncbi:GAF and ANTAR domain-containing protein [Umezawaea sp. NPDC059074]|uniref:GAF and ANTAR domain-containing protein n=1 Tax=Umezawaea sp. NPDC059074 TaxID=3346716 RepID=UPI0036B87314
MDVQQRSIRFPLCRPTATGRAATTEERRMTSPTNISFSTLASELAEMTRLVEDEDHEAIARRFTNHLARTVGSCDLAFLAVSSAGGFEVVVSSAQPPHIVGIDDNPIREVLRYGEPRRLGDSAQEQRWPAFAAGLAEQGYRDCLVLPLPAEHVPATAVTLLSREPHRFTDHSYDVILLIAVHAGVALDNIEVLHRSKQMVQHLTTALGTRHIIGVAQGLLMRHFSCDVDSSYELLRRASQSTNRKLRDIASDLVEGQEQDRFSEVLARLGATGTRHR